MDLRKANAGQKGLSHLGPKTCSKINPNKQTF